MQRSWCRIDVDEEDDVGDMRSILGRRRAGRVKVDFDTGQVEMVR